MLGLLAWLFNTAETQKPVFIDISHRRLGEEHCRTLNILRTVLAITNL